MTPLDFRNTNSLWASVLVETLVRRGLRQAVISPGSRSTPLTMALARHDAVEAMPVLDERSAGFFALGLARQTRQPVVLVCTSGSAGAHWLPALIEARESGTPLIALTADRPPELRECASGQTIDQAHLFGRYATWYHELAVPAPGMELLAYLRQALRQAWDRATRDGPVHLNVPFRDPLPPVPDGGDAPALESTWSDEFFAELTAPEVSAAQLKIRQKVTMTRGLIVAGPAQPDNPVAYAAAVHQLAQASGWPILADALSPLRHHAAPEGVVVVAAYDALLRHEKVRAELTPRYVIGLESWPTSKVLREFLTTSQAETLLVSPRPGSRDALQGKTREITADVTSLVIDSTAIADASYRDAWQQAEVKAAATLAQALADPVHDGFEGALVPALAAGLPAGAALVVANSMPVRDVEYFWPANDRGVEVFFSRGANGIDGTLSTALGVAHRGKPTVLLTGDLALLHDTNGWLLASEFVGSLTVVLVNNAGGGIFGHLPVADFEPPFERFFATPQSVDFSKLAAAYGVAHQRVAGAEALRSALATLPAGIRLLEIATDRKSDAATRKRILRDATTG